MRSSVYWFGIVRGASRMIGENRWIPWLMNSKHAYGCWIGYNNSWAGWWGHGMLLHTQKSSSTQALSRGHACSRERNLKSRAQRSTPELPERRRSSCLPKKNNSDRSPAHLHHSHHPSENYNQNIWFFQHISLFTTEPVTRLRMPQSINPIL